MKHFCKRLALVLAVLTCLSLVATAFVGCGGGSGGTETSPDSGATTPTTGNGETSPNPQTGKINHTLTVKSAGGLPLSKVNIYIYADATLEDLIDYGTTGEDGVAVIALPSSQTHVAVLSGLPEGYNPEASYPLTGTDTAIAVTSSVITDNTDISGVTYTLGSVMRDFKVTDTDGKVHQLSELLKDKKMVMLNFWATWCGPCREEFPFMNAAYEQYKSTVEILALDPDQDSSETESAIAAYKANMGLSFPMLKDYTTLATSFALTGYPTTVVIDRYGVVSLVHAGAIPSESYFTAIFNYYSAADYEQKLITDLSELLPKEKPTVSMPTSDEIAGIFANGVNATFSPETSESDAEYSWPFVIGKKDGVDCIMPSNAGKHSSYATMYTTVTLKKGDALAFDYMASSEIGVDVLYTLVKRNDINGDTYKDIYQISGLDNRWNTCYTFVAAEDGEYSIGFCFIKDTSASAGDDTVYLKNLRVVKASAIDLPTYIPRYAANDLKEDHSGYNSYATVVMGDDGYYHVGTKDGPLLLVDLMKPTRFSQTALYSFALDNKLVLDGKNYYEDLIPYASYASNSAIAGLCPVNDKLKTILEAAAAVLGIEAGNKDQWLQMCCYYDAYGTGGVQLADPTKGLYTSDANNNAIIEEGKPFTAVLGENSFTYDRLIMPRGLVAEFVPEKSGAYRITSKSDTLVEGWIFDENGRDYYVYEGGERLYTDENNVSMVVYFEAGKSYYIDICYYDVYQTGVINYELTYIGEHYEQFTIASPGYFTFPDNTESGDNLNDELAEILAGGIDVMLGEDGFYHEKMADGSMGSVIYADFISTSAVFGSDSIETLISKGSFDFTKTDPDEYILSYIDKHGDNTRAYLQQLWGDQFEELAAVNKLDEVLAGKMHGTGTDETEAIRAYVAKKIAASAEHPELEGCVPVDEELGRLLQALMDKYTFKGVEHSWTKLCYYYRQIG